MLILGWIIRVIFIKKNGTKGTDYVFNILGSFLRVLSDYSLEVSDGSSQLLPRQDSISVLVKYLETYCEIGGREMGGRCTETMERRRERRSGV